MPLYDYLTPKLDFKRKFDHRQSFLYKGRLVRTIRKFRIGSSLRIESRIGSSIRKPNRISKLRRSLLIIATHHFYHQQLPKTHDSTCTRIALSAKSTAQDHYKKIDDIIN